MIAFNLARATAVAADMRTARWATLRKVISVPPARAEQRVGAAYKHALIPDDT